MTAEERRKKLMDILTQTDTPLSGSSLGTETGVSRQVVVQDIAILRSQGIDVTATARGYFIKKNTRPVRLLKVCHTNSQIEEELNSIVDLGGEVHDVIVNHKTYGKMQADMKIRCRRDVKEFLNCIESGKSTPLLNITSGYHFHHISADSESILDEIECDLKKKSFLAEILPYEKELF